MTLKHIFDKAASAGALLALSPVFAGIMAVNAAYYRRNPFYTVQRQGKDSVPYRMLKFRSMYEKTDESGQSLPDRERMSQWGKFLRATSLDELPQLINILKGDMSIVGPRPLPPSSFEGDTAAPYKDDILAVRPGLTGPWQVAVIGSDADVSGEDRLKLDASYAKDKPTFLKDAALMLKTIPAFFQGHNGESLQKRAPKP